MTQFERIIEEAIDEAEAVDCPFLEFVQGLEEMKEELDDRVSSARDELAGMDNGE